MNIEKYLGEIRSENRICSSFFEDLLNYNGNIGEAIEDIARSSTESDRYFIDKLIKGGILISFQQWKVGHPQGTWEEYAESAYTYARDFLFPSYLTEALTYYFLDHYCYDCGHEEIDEDIIVGIEKMISNYYTIDDDIDEVMSDLMRSFNLSD